MIDREITPDDQQLTELLGQRPTTEALAWLERPRVSGEKRIIGAPPGRMLDEMAALGFVRDLYRAGAEAVHAVNTVQEPGADDRADGLLIVLPDLAEARSRLFALANREEHDLGRDPTRDEAQRYLLVTWS
jgi:hypothetical protein